MTSASDSGVLVAVLGTGIMGSAMARNLVNTGFRTAVWDRSPAVTAALAAATSDELPALAASSDAWHSAVDAGHGREDVAAALLALSR